MFHIVSKCFLTGWWLLVPINCPCMAEKVIMLCHLEVFLLCWYIIWYMHYSLYYSALFSWWCLVCTANWTTPTIWNLAEQEKTVEKKWILLLAICGLKAEKKDYIVVLYIILTKWRTPSRTVIPKCVNPSQKSQAGNGENKNCLPLWSDTRYTLCKVSKSVSKSPSVYRKVNFTMISYSINFTFNGLYFSAFVWCDTFKFVIGWRCEETTSILLCHLTLGFFIVH